MDIRNMRNNFLLYLLCLSLLCGNCIMHTYFIRVSILMSTDISITTHTNLIILGVNSIDMLFFYLMFLYMILKHFSVYIYSCC